jgi:NhaP-type Na+/H+ and K+/H+ antiporter
MLATVRQGFAPSERLLLAWAGLRGAVPVILATFAVIDGVPRSIEMLNIVFFAVLLSAMLQGPTVHHLARRLQERRSQLRADGDEADRVSPPLRNPSVPIRGAAAGLQLISCGKDDRRE